MGAEISNQLAAKIQHARDARGYSQKFVADSLGFTQAIVSKVEAGKLNTVSTDTLKRICDFLEVPWPAEEQDLNSIWICATATCLQNIPFFDPEENLRFRPVRVKKRDPEIQWCPGCKGELINKCPHCKKALSGEDPFCPYCREPILTTPSRLEDHKEALKFIENFDRSRARLLLNSPFNLQIEEAPVKPDRSK